MYMEAMSCPADHRLISGGAAAAHAAGVAVLGAWGLAAGPGDPFTRLPHERGLAVGASLLEAIAIGLEEATSNKGIPHFWIFGWVGVRAVWSLLHKIHSRRNLTIFCRRIPCEQHEPFQLLRNMTLKNWVKEYQSCKAWSFHHPSHLALHARGYIVSHSNPSASSLVANLTNDHTCIQSRPWCWSAFL